MIRRCMHRVMRSFIIHMSSSTARRANADTLVKHLPNAELSEAVNGRDPAQIADIHCHPGNLFKPSYPFALRPAEIGVFQSHRRIWRKMVEENIDLAIITEDDLAIDPGRFARTLDLLQDHATVDSYVRLPVKQRETAVQVVAEKDDLRLILPKIIGLQCICQVVGREAARRLLGVTDQIDRPVDTLLQMHWVTKQPVHTVLGTGNREVAAQIGGSTIQTKIRPSGKLGREWKRGVYRAQLALRPQKP
ncbi:Glycosyltransferase family 25 (LPS biosynthesis protein) [Falsiruegeria litorea R37]|uniref:Glycosyltransferase family 25 (LPS biosynthesis protein) n=2 Tax=Falsiruegeria litorea TaxID=1280831 RepID=A0A1Y5TCL2_9RHOB|nr:Glycosyltransferase family 25 (LPS biosynthesis protein) [Falsiruegeria litorea R37]